MEYGHGFGSWGAGAFWIFIAAAAVVGSWEKSRRNAEKHETLRRIIEKTGNVDEAKLKELFSPSGPDWMNSKPGETWRGMRIAGGVILGLAAGLAFVFTVLGYCDVVPHSAFIIGVTIAGAVAIFGVGLFLSARFAEPPPGRGNGPYG